ncbi:hypothetical protein GGX14DRAFT_676261 [Mycena pura]|uniref:Uncharacterized protein n=1 Tax=Mycena pura TaxID=153505 RepID=A0AAD6VRY2_9AGAR|nr:hypothetical protein GGX14DRAFT_676261 [Mycena pura]
MRADLLAPVLPPDLERQILQIYAYSRPVVIPKLMLVAWRVKEWVEPLLYRTIIISGNPPIEGYPSFTSDIVKAAIQSKPPEFFRNSVRNVLLHVFDLGLVHLVLSVCTGVENLWAPFTVRGLFDQPPCPMPPLKHLYTTCLSLLPHISGAHPLFAQLTHLELIGSPNEGELEQWAAKLPLLPQLTHLSFDEEDFLPICPALLQQCKLLVVLACLDGKPLIGATTHIYEEELSKDPRFAVLVSQWFRDWQLGVHNGDDYWRRAEQFIATRRILGDRHFLAQRQSKNIDAKIYEVPDEIEHI